MNLPVLQRETNPLVTVLIAAGRVNVPMLLWGAPGIGKSSLVNSMARAEGLHLETVITSVREPSDLAGLPVVSDGGVRLAPPAWAVNLNTDEGGLLFLDELSSAPPAVQAAALRVTLDRVVGDLALPRSVRVIAAANPPEHAADGWDLPAPAANRFLHVDHAPTHETWIDGMLSGFPLPAPGRVFEAGPARQAQARAEVATFIRLRPELLHAMPDDPARAGRAWASNRTWTMGADVLSILDPEDTDAVMLALGGLVGDGPASEFITWRDENDLPHPADVVDDPESVPWDGLDPARLRAEVRDRPGRRGTRRLTGGAAGGGVPAPGFLTMDEPLSPPRMARTAARGPTLSAHGERCGPHRVRHGARPIRCSGPTTADRVGPKHVADDRDDTRNELHRLAGIRRASSRPRP